MTPLSRAWRVMRRGVALAFVLTIFVDAAALTVPLYDMQLYDRVLQSRNMDTLAVLSAVCAAGLLLYAAVDRLRAAVFSAVADGVTRRLHLPLLAESVRLGAAGDHGAGAQAIRDLQAVRHFLGGGALAVPLDALCSPLLLAVLFMLHPAFGWLALMGAALLVMCGLVGDQLARPGMLDATGRRTRTDQELSVRLRETELIEGMGMLPAIAGRWACAQSLATAGLRTASGRVNLIAGLSKTLRLALSAGVMVLGAVLIVGGETSPGALMGANLLLNKLLNPFDHLVVGWRHWTLAAAAWRRVSACLAAAGEPSAEAGFDAVEHPPGLIAIGVSHRDQRSGRTILEDIDLTVPPGSAVGVVGLNGAGKTTLLRILAGLLTPTDGAVLLDGMMIADVDRARMGFLPQDTSLLDGTLAENISRFAAHDPEGVIAAARAANVHELIGRLRQGYETRFTVDTTEFSGGQRQRIGLARAVYGMPRLLILDEPDSNLDDSGETALKEAIATVRGAGGIVIVTTHRKGLLASLDHVIRLDEGRIVAAGPPANTVIGAAAADPRPADLSVAV